MDLKKLAAALIPDNDLLPPESYEEIYPERARAPKAEVTRLAPSPTGFIHLGNLYSALADERSAHTTGGIFYLRIEDTDENPCDLSLITYGLPAARFAYIRSSERFRHFA